MEWKSSVEKSGARKSGPLENSISKIEKNSSNREVLLMFLETISN